MGLPIKHRKKYVSHKKKWDKNTIVEEAVLVKDYGLKNKKEIRKVELQLSKFKTLAKSFNKSSETKNSVEAKNFVNKLKAAGYLNVDATSLDEVLDIELRDILERRLSNILYKNKLAKTPKQARQFITHKHVKIAGRMVDSPSYSVTLAEEAQLEFNETSSLSDEEHPERKIEVETIVSVSESVENDSEKSSFDKNEEFRDNEEAVEVKE